MDRQARQSWSNCQVVEADIAVDGYALPYVVLVGILRQISAEALRAFPLKWVNIADPIFRITIKATAFCLKALSIHVSLCLATRGIAFFAADELVDVYGSLNIVLRMQAQEFIILAGQLFVRSRTVWLERIKLVKRILKELGALRFLNGLCASQGAGRKYRPAAPAVPRHAGLGSGGGR